ncbi:hypothetical protein LCGC14_0238830 [marine sediment metagenome]|uniref:GTP cyclohydrolase 1 type 2 homolog n=1 Tax=marine sediment metagenome TaxID=412755 RepID=A0A0F9WSW7_9ZZZZ|nr:Nif3-like dinuclear metal center hexameric protein [Phycisphaerae bacterium]
MKVADVARELEAIAPLDLAAEWDNVGLLVGDRQGSVEKLMLCVDLTEAVLAEAVSAKAQMVMAYHPVIFKTISRVTADAAPVVYAAARRGLAVYSMHTALDSAPGGTNDVLAEVLGLVGARPLEAAHDHHRCKIVVFVPANDLANVAEAAFAAGAGRIGEYQDCAFFSHGIGTFVAGRAAQPTVGRPGQHEAVEEVRFEAIAPIARVADVAMAIRAAHSYEEPAIDVYRLEHLPDACGMGRIGRLNEPVDESALVERIKTATGLKQVWIARAASKSPSHGPITVAACAAGSAGGMFEAAASGGATFYLTGEMRHHDALAANAAGLTVACLGHSNSERLTLQHLAKRLRKRISDLKVAVSKKDADPFEIV